MKREKLWIFLIVFCAVFYIIYQLYMVFFYGVINFPRASKVAHYKFDPVNFYIGVFFAISALFFCFLCLIKIIYPNLFDRILDKIFMLFPCDNDSKSKKRRKKKK